MILETRLLSKSGAGPAVVGAVTGIGASTLRWSVAGSHGLCMALDTGTWSRCWYCTLKETTNEAGDKPHSGPRKPSVIYV